MKYFGDLALGTKKALKQQNVKRVEVKQYKELSADLALEMFKQDASCWNYVPEHWGAKPKLKKDRDYFWTVLASIRSAFVKQIVDHADSLRHIQPKNSNQQ